MCLSCFFTPDTLGTIQYPGDRCSRHREKGAALTETLPNSTYLSFILRIWRERDLERPDSPLGEWQGEVEHIQTGERRSFNSIDAVVDFLRAQVVESGQMSPSRAP